MTSHCSSSSSRFQYRQASAASARHWYEEPYNQSHDERRYGASALPGPSRRRDDQYRYEAQSSQMVAPQPPGKQDRGGIDTSRTPGGRRHNDSGFRSSSVSHHTAGPLSSSCSSHHHRPLPLRQPMPPKPPITGSTIKPEDHQPNAEVRSRHLRRSEPSAPPPVLTTRRARGDVRSWPSNTSSSRHDRRAEFPVQSEKGSQRRTFLNFRRMPLHNSLPVRPIRLERQPEEMDMSTQRVIPSNLRATHRSLPLERSLHLGPDTEAEPSLRAEVEASCFTAQPFQILAEAAALAKPHSSFSGHDKVGVNGKIPQVEQQASKEAKNKSNRRVTIQKESLPRNEPSASITTKWHLGLGAMSRDHCTTTSSLQTSSSDRSHFRVSSEAQTPEQVEMKKAGSLIQRAKVFGKERKRQRQREECRAGERPKKEGPTPNPENSNQSDRDVPLETLTTGRQDDSVTSSLDVHFPIPACPPVASLSANPPLPKRPRQDVSTSLKMSSTSDKALRAIYCKHPVNFSIAEYMTHSAAPKLGETDSPASQTKVQGRKEKEHDSLIEPAACDTGAAMDISPRRSQLPGPGGLDIDHHDSSPIPASVLSDDISPSVILNSNGREIPDLLKRDSQSPKTDGAATCCQTSLAITEVGSDEIVPAKADSDLRICEREGIERIALGPKRRVDQAIRWKWLALLECQSSLSRKSSGSDFPAPAMLSISVKGKISLRLLSRDLSTSFASPTLSLPTDSKIEAVRRVSSHSVAVASSSSSRIGEGTSQVSLIFAKDIGRDCSWDDHVDPSPESDQPRTAQASVLHLEPRPHIIGPTSIAPFLPPLNSHSHSTCSLVTGGADGSVFAWSYPGVGSMTTTTRLHALHSGSVSALETLPKLNLVVSASNTAHRAGTQLLAFDARETKLVHSWKSSDSAAQVSRTTASRVLDVSFLRADYDQHKLYDLRTSSSTADSDCNTGALRSSTKPVLSFGWASEYDVSWLGRPAFKGSYCIQGCPDGKVRTWDLRHCSEVLEEVAVAVTAMPLSDVLVWDVERQGASKIEKTREVGHVNSLLALSPEAVWKIPLVTRI